MYNIAHIGVVVKDLETSKKFYSEVLGLKECRSHEDERLKIAFMDSGNGIIELIQYTAEGLERTSGVVDHIAFKVTDIEESVDKLKNAGVKLIFDAPKPFEEGKIFFFYGPDGERLEFVQD
ncbi:MAG: VOC family protein [Solirubrobacterales bacterium]